MPTYADAVGEIQTDFLNRTDFTNQVKNAVNRTIRHYNRERYQWNQTVTILTAVALTETLPLPADFLTLDRLEYQYNGTDRLHIIEQDLEVIRQINVAQDVGTPEYYTIYGANFYFANVPDSAYPIYCFYLQKFPDLSADSDTSPWLDNAYDLVVAGAAKLVWATTIRNVSAAQVCAQLESDYAKELRAYRDANQMGKIKATSF